MALSEDIEGVEILLILGAVGALIYGVYYIVKNLGGPGTPDPGGGAPATSVLGNLLNQTLEIGQSSESYSDALDQTVTNPFTTASTIVSGWWNDATGG